MSAHTEEEFKLFMSQLKETNQTLDFFCDFDKINDNVEEIKLSLCILNSMIGSTDLRKSVETIWNRVKSAFSVMDILIAVRNKDKKKVIDSLGNCIPVEKLFDSVDGVMEFLEETGLAEVFTSRKVKDMVDYVFGIETPSKVYLMEVNFYSGGGSKLNEVARSYSDISPKINSVPGYEFIWITDGKGWQSAKNKLQEAFSIIPFPM